MKKKILLGIIIFASGCVFLINKAVASTEVAGNITSETTWYESESPYIVKTPVKILAPLIIEPGVVVKFKYDKTGGSDNGYLNVNNELKAVGTPEKKIIFTSIRDDESGGDNNNDGSATAPARDDWYGINIYDNSYNSKLEYAVILYAERGINYYNYASSNFRGLILRNSEIKFCSEGLKVFNAIPIVENNKIEQNRTGIVAYSSPSKGRVPTFYNNSISRNTIIGLDGRDIYGLKSIKIDARHNWWGDASGPDPVGNGNKILGSGIIFDSWLGEPPQPMPKKPIVLIPGIGASVNWDLMLGGIFPEKWTLMSHTYDGIIEALKKMGYEEDKNLFICYYDWRNKNAISAENYLKPIIDKAISKSGAFQVNIAAHSMGGLVARSYIQSAGYGNDVENLIMIGTPNKGSSDVYPVWEGGRIPKNWETRLAFTAYIDYLRAKNFTYSPYQIIHQYIPSVKELMPVYNYIHPKDNPDLLKNYLVMKERNDWLVYLNSQIYALNQKVKVTTISGNGQPTVNKIPIVNANESPLWMDGKPEPIDPARSDVIGDKRVLLSSSQITQSYLSKILDYDHGDIVSQSENLVADLLEEKLDKIYPAPEIRDEISFWFASPVDVEIKSPSGEILTKDVNNIPLAIYSGESKPDGFKFISIPNPVNGEYKIKLTGNGEGEYHAGSIYADYKNDIPDRESEKDGTISAGEIKEYKISYDPQNIDDPIGDIELADTTPPAITNGSPNGELPDAVTETQISLQTDEKATCKYATDPDIAFDSMPDDFTASDGISHSVAVSGLKQWQSYNFYVKCRDETGNTNQEDYIISFKIPDTTLPTITGAATAQPNTNGWYNTDVVVRFSASDAESGIESVTPDVTISTEGANQSATGTATDKAGNSASFTVTGINIDKTSPAIKIVSPENKNYLNDNYALIFSSEINDPLSGVETSSTEKLLNNQLFEDEKLNLSLKNMGSYNYQVRVKDKAGNLGSAEINFQNATIISAVRNNLNHYWDLGLVKKKIAKRYFSVRLKRLENLFNLLEKTKNSKLKPKPKQAAIDALKKVINMDIDIFIKQINRKSPRWIDQSAAEFLIEDLNFIRSKI